MVHIFAITKEMTIKEDLTLDQLNDEAIEWYWVDFDRPTQSESYLLDSHFHFHSLAIEDCLFLLQRPKVDHYNEYDFFVFQALDEENMEPIELDLFLGNNFVVTYHNTHLAQIDEVLIKLKQSEIKQSEGSTVVCYEVLNKIVDYYFPHVYQLEDMIDEIEENGSKVSTKKLLDKIFDLRSDLLRVLRIVNQMEQLVYRLLEVEMFEKKRMYFSDTYDHLLKLKEMIESSLSISAEIRESYISYNSYLMNKNMMVLTVISAIFIPLTFIAGVYGMNFDNMPELNYKYGYFIVLALMGILSICMVLWFKKKGWFDTDK